MTDMLEINVLEFPKCTAINMLRSRMVMKLMLYKNQKSRTSRLSEPIICAPST
jgi:hypothetical protein